MAIVVAVATPLDDELFKQFIKAYLKAQMPDQITPEVDPEPCKQLFKARLFDFYYENLYMDCYRFYQQCEDYFETAVAKEPK